MPRQLIEQTSLLWQATDENTWFHALSALGRRLRYTYTLYAVVPRPGMRPGMKHVDTYVRSNYPTEWSQIYHDEGYVLIDPTLAHCWTQTRPLIWSSPQFVGSEQRRLYEKACQFGLRAGVTLPIHGPKHEAGMLCFVSSDNPTTTVLSRMERDLPKLTLLRDIAFDTSRRFLNDYTETRIPKLTPREGECLKWTARGKSTWEIAKIFGCSEATVNFHMSNIRTKFGVSSRSAAAVKATRMGLIDPD
jgi:LuxR family quorum-sensing transcriptional regulator LasR